MDPFCLQLLTNGREIGKRVEKIFSDSNRILLKRYAAIATFRAVPSDSVRMRKVLVASDPELQGFLNDLIAQENE